VIEQPLKSVSGHLQARQLPAGHRTTTYNTNNN